MDRIDDKRLIGNQISTQKALAKKNIDCKKMI